MIVLVACGQVSAAEVRDPFLFGPQDTAQGGTGQPILTGILWDANNPMAVISDEPVTVGQTVNGWQVIQIEPDAIVIQRESRTETLSPGSALPSD